MRNCIRCGLTKPVELFRKFRKGRELVSTLTCLSCLDPRGTLLPAEETNLPEPMSGGSNGPPVRDFYEMLTVPS